MDRILTNALGGVSALLDSLEERVTALVDKAGGEVEIGDEGDAICAYPVIGYEVVEFQVSRIRTRGRSLEMQFSDTAGMRPWYGLDDCLRAPTLLSVAENICEYLPE